MDIIYLLIPLAVILLSIGLGLFFWAVKNDQFEDLEGPAHSILFEEPDLEAATKNAANEKSNDPS